MVVGALGSMPGVSPVGELLVFLVVCVGLGIGIGALDVLIDVGGR